uniref:Uncharacterized protein n=1 Tax=Rhizophora mucronata TaxID=61149 RepID=A0A2P2K144_RHIMU
MLSCLINWWVLNGLVVWGSSSQKDKGVKAYVKWRKRVESQKKKELFEDKDQFFLMDLDQFL